MADTTSDPAMDYINNTVTGDDDDQCPICTTKWGEIREDGEMEIPWRCPDCHKLVGDWCLDVHIHTTPYPACHKCPCCRAWLEDFGPDDESEEDLEDESTSEDEEESGDGEDAGPETDETSDDEEDEEEDALDFDDSLVASRELRSWWTMESPDHHRELLFAEALWSVRERQRRIQAENDAQWNDEWDVDRETPEEEAVRLENAARIARCARPDFMKSGLSIQEFSCGIPEVRECRDSLDAYRPLIRIKPPMPDALRKDDDREYRYSLFDHTLDQLCEDLEGLCIVEPSSSSFQNAMSSLCQALEQFRVSR